MLPGSIYRRFSRQSKLTSHLVSQRNSLIFPSSLRLKCCSNGEQEDVSVRSTGRPPRCGRAYNVLLFFFPPIGQWLLKGRIPFDRALSYESTIKSAQIGRE